MPPPIGPKTLRKTFDYHRAHPEIGLDQHVKQRHVELGESLSDRTAVYLDTKFWIIIRDVVLGRRTNDIDREFLDKLRSLAAAETIFCPISESALIEILKQQDLSCLAVTAALVDELSSGICLTAPETRSGTEIAHFVHSIMGAQNLHPLRHLVWSKVSYALGVMHPNPQGVDQDTQLMMNKAFFDHMWSIPFTEMAKMVGGAPLPNPERFDKLSERLNNESPQHAHEIRSYQQAYTSEIRGTIDLYSSVAADVTCDLQWQGESSGPERGGDSWKKIDNMWRHALSAALEQDDGKRKLPSIHVPASLHAAIRWNKARKFKANDFYDINHATAALAYCDMFFTEKPLRQLVTEKHVALDNFHECRVAADVDEALGLLSQ